MLVERLKSAIPLILVVCIVFFAPMKISAWLFALLTLAMAYLACRETFDLLNPTFKKRHFMLAFLLGLLLILPPMASYGSSAWDCQWLAKISDFVQTGYPAIFALAILLAFAYTFKHEPTRENVHGILASMGAFVFIAWQISFLVRLFFYPVIPVLNGLTGGGDPRFLLFYLIIVTKMADVGAFAIGVTAAKRPGGNHKLAPKISPKKSWEGLLGGTIFSLITSLIFCACALPQLKLNGIQIIGWADAVIIGILASPIGLLGDLCESALKRSADAKDSGKLPGLGGILDTLDSLLPMGPLFFAYLAFKTTIL